MKSRLGHDFSRVRVHTDAMGAASARAVNALAYTVGQHVAFASSQFAPQTRTGKRLLLHELAHTVQQRGARPYRACQPLQVGPADDCFEIEAEDAAVSAQRKPNERMTFLDGGRDLRLQRQTPHAAVRTPASPEAREHPRNSAEPAISGSPYSSIFPGYSQSGDTCGASSLVTALAIWDREHWDPAQPNSRVVTACNLILIEYGSSGDAAVGRWTANPVPAISLRYNGNRQRIRDAYMAERQQREDDLRRIREAARQPGARFSEADYQALGLAIYFLWQEGSHPGLTTARIGEIRRTLGLESSDPQSSDRLESFAAIFTHRIITTLARDEFAQVNWLIGNGQPHSVLIGHLAIDGHPPIDEWYFSDQGPNPAVEYRAPTLSALRATVRGAIALGYWLFDGTTGDCVARFPRHQLRCLNTNVSRLRSNTGVETQGQDLVPPGAFLGEVDEGYTTIGDRLSRGAFVGRFYSLGEAQARFANARGGGLIVEMPRGVFSLYTTSAVSDANLNEIGLDAADSGGGVLARHTFLRAWLILGTAAGRLGVWLPIY